MFKKLLLFLFFISSVSIVAEDTFERNENFLYNNFNPISYQPLAFNTYLNDSYNLRISNTLITTSSSNYFILGNRQDDISNSPLANHKFDEELNINIITAQMMFLNNFHLSLNLPYYFNHSLSSEINFSDGGSFKEKRDTDNGIGDIEAMLDYELLTSETYRLFLGFGVKLPTSDYQNLFSGVKLSSGSPDLLLKASLDSRIFHNFKLFSSVAYTLKGSRDFEVTTDFFPTVNIENVDYPYYSFLNSDQYEPYDELSIYAAGDYEFSDYLSAGLGVYFLHTIGSDDNKIIDDFYDYHISSFIPYVTFNSESFGLPLIVNVGYNYNASGDNIKQVNSFNFSLSYQFNVLL